MGKQAALGSYTSRGGVATYSVVTTPTRTSSCIFFSFSSFHHVGHIRRFSSVEVSQGALNSGNSACCGIANNLRWYMLSSLGSSSASSWISAT